MGNGGRRGHCVKCSNLFMDHEECSHLCLGQLYPVLMPPLLPPTHPSVPLPCLYLPLVLVHRCPEPLHLCHAPWILHSYPWTLMSQSYFHESVSFRI